MKKDLAREGGLEKWSGNQGTLVSVLTGDGQLYARVVGIGELGGTRGKKAPRIHKARSGWPRPGPAHPGLLPVCRGSKKVGQPSAPF